MEGMDISMEEQRKNSAYRHSPQQIALLEEFFVRYPYPNDKQRQQLSKDLGLEPTQIQFWFQNKRVQVKSQRGRVHTIALRDENARIRRENLEMRAALENTKCPSCSGTTSEALQRLEVENACLKEEHELLQRMLLPLITKANEQAEIQCNNSPKDILGKQPQTSSEGEIRAQQFQEEKSTSSSTGHGPKLIKFF